MEKVLKPHDKELMRMAMLKHEETFREQVYELHRLYRVQKMLMNSAGDTSPRKQDQRSSNVADQIRASSLVADNQQQQAQRNTDDQVGPGIAKQERIAESNQIDDSEIELTLSLGPTTYKPILDKSKSGQSVSSTSTGSSQTRKISPKNNSRSSAQDFMWVASGNNNKHTFSHQGSESVDPGFSNGQQSNPPWMFQALSLKLS